MKLNELFITDEIGCKFHDGLNIILGINREPEKIDIGDFADSDENSAADESTDEQESKEDDQSLHTSETADDKSAAEELNISDTNGVGKTMLLSAIKYVLGGDTETVLSSSFFTETQYWGMLEVTIGEEFFVFSRPLWRPLGDDLYLTFNGSIDEIQENLKKAKIVLEEITSSRELSEQLERYESKITQMSKKEFQRYIAKLENIDYSKSNITFSALLDFIIRDEKVGFSDPIARIRRAQWIQYRSIQYLFGLPAWTEESSSKLQEQIAELNTNLKAMHKQLSSRKITSDDKIENLKLHAMAKLKKVQEDIENVKVIPSIELVRLEYQKVKAQYTDVVSNLNKKEHYLSGYLKNRKDLQSKFKATMELLKVSDFYDDLIQFFPDQLEENLAEFQSFFDGVTDDRERYYTDLITEIRADIKFIKAEKAHLEPRLATLAEQLKSTSLLRDISTLAATEEKIQSEINELEECRKLLLECETLEEKVTELNSQRRNFLAEGKKQEKQFQARRRGLISLFHEFVSDIYGADDGELAFEYNANESSSTAGRTEITCRIPSQSSHGRTYAKINIFDFVWFLGEKGDEDFNPGFLAHDGSYSKISRDVKKKMLKAINSRLNGKQYFITINEGELDIYPEWEDYICCRLDGSEVEGKFFHQQFD